MYRDAGKIQLEVSYLFLVTAINITNVITITEQ